MDQLFKKLLYLYYKELGNLSIGYQLNQDNLDSMMLLIYCIDYLANGEPSKNEILKILANYGN